MRVHRQSLLPLAAALLGLLAVLVRQQVVMAADDHDVFLGSWERDTPSTGEAVTMTVESRGGGILFLLITGKDGVRREMLAFRQDGKDYPYAVRGGPLTSTAAALPAGPRGLDVTFKIAGGPGRVARWTVSSVGDVMTLGRPDGTTWRMRRTAAGRAASPPPLKSGYKRYVGSWAAVRTRSGATTGSVVWEDRGDDFVVATVRDVKGVVTMRYSLKYDGLEYPCLTDSARGGVGSITSRFVNEYQTVWTLLSDGKPFNNGERVVQPDGKMMTVPGESTSNDLVWRWVKPAPTDGILRP